MCKVLFQRTEIREMSSTVIDLVVPAAAAALSTWHFKNYIAIIFCCLLTQGDELPECQTWIFFPSMSLVTSGFQVHIYIQAATSSTLFLEVLSYIRYLRFAELFLFYTQKRLGKSSSSSLWGCVQQILPSAQLRFLDW